MWHGRLLGCPWLLLAKIELSRTIPAGREQVGAGPHCFNTSHPAVPPAVGATQQGRICRVPGSNPSANVGAKDQDGCIVLLLADAHPLP